MAIVPGPSASPGCRSGTSSPLYPGGGVLSRAPWGWVQCDARVTSWQPRVPGGVLLAELLLEGPRARCGWEQAGAQLGKCLPRSSGHKPLADTNARLGCLGASLQQGVPPGPLGQLCQQAGLQRAGTGYCGSGGVLWPPHATLACHGAALLWGPAVLGGGRGPVPAAAGLRLGGRTRGAESWGGRGPTQEPSQAGPVRLSRSPPPRPCLQCPAPRRAERGARTRPDTCFRLAQTMTHTGSGLRADTLISSAGQLCPGHVPVPSAVGRVDLSPCTWPPGSCSSRGTSPALTGRQLATGHVGHSAFACASLGTASSGLTRPPGPGPVAPQHLSWSRGCAGGCPRAWPCRVAPSCPLGSAGRSALHPARKWGLPKPRPPAPPGHPASCPACPCPGPFPSDLAGPHPAPPRAGRIPGAWEAAGAQGSGAVWAAGPSAPASPQTGPGCGVPGPPDPQPHGALGAAKRPAAPRRAAAPMPWAAGPAGILATAAEASANCAPCSEVGDLEPHLQVSSNILVA